MSKSASPTKVGAFVIAGIGLALVAIIVLGGGRLGRDTAKVIVHFDGSVSGLRVGAPVKFRGIEIGAVDAVRINMSGAMRDPANVRIPVVLEIDQDLLTAEGVVGIDLHDRATVRRLVDRGLRAELATESLVTGIRYVALDVKPDTPVRLVNDPTVDYPEIPSIQSSMEQIPEKLNRLLANLAEIDLARLETTLQATADGARRLITSPDLARAVAGLDELTQTLNATATQLQQTTRELAPVSAELRRAAGSTRRLVAPEGTLLVQLEATLTEVKAAGRSVRRLADQISRDPGSILRGGRP